MNSRRSHPVILPFSMSVSLCLQFLFQLIQETPIGALRNELLRVGLDHSHLVQPQSMKTYGVFGVGLPPAFVIEASKHLQPNFVARFIAFGHEKLGSPFRLPG